MSCTWRGGELGTEPHERPHPVPSRAPVRVNMIIIVKTTSGDRAGGERASINQSVVPGARRIGRHPSAVVTDALQLFTFFFLLSLALYGHSCNLPARYGNRSRTIAVSRAVRSAQSYSDNGVNGENRRTRRKKRLDAKIACTAANDRRTRLLRCDGSFVRANRAAHVNHGGVRRGYRGRLVRLAIRRGGGFIVHRWGGGETLYGSALKFKAIL